MHDLYVLGVVVVEIIKIIAIIHVLVDNRQPVKTMAWMLVIYFLPLVGVVFYLFFGVNTRRQRMVSERSMNQLTKRSMLEFVEQHDLHVPDECRKLVDLFVNENFSLPFKDNAVDIYTEGYGFFRQLLKDIHGAQGHIHMDFYIFEDDALGRLVADALIDKARQGVEVRVVYDDVGCWHVGRAFFERMREAGIEVNPFLPVRFPSFTSKVNYRNHRKIVVIDGRVGYIGGMNIALRYVKGTERGAWRDTMLRLRGGAVYGLQRSFLVDWYFVDRTLISHRRYYPPLDGSTVGDGLAQIVTSGPVTPYLEIMQGYVRIILAARRYVYIETPYFLPTESVLFALKTAVMGGVDVRLIVPRHSDARFVEWASRSYLRDVVKTGVSVFLYEDGFLHSKLLVSDDSVVSCGSTNVDFRSFENNFEANAFFYDASVARRFREVFLADQLRSVDFAEVCGLGRISFARRLWESITRLFSPLL